jgi:hypothetical protein
MVNVGWVRIQDFQDDNLQEKNKRIKVPKKLARQEPDHFDVTYQYPVGIRGQVYKIKLT